MKKQNQNKTNKKTTKKQQKKQVTIPIMLYLPLEQGRRTTLTKAERVHQTKFP